MVAAVFTKRNRRKIFTVILRIYFWIFLMRRGCVHQQWLFSSNPCIKISTTFTHFENKSVFHLRVL